MQTEYDTLSLVKELRFEEDGRKVVVKLHPKDQPYSPNRPVAELNLPGDLNASTVPMEELLRVIDDRVAIDLDEIYGRGQFAGVADRDPELDRMRKMLEARK